MRGRALEQLPASPSPRARWLVRIAVPGFPTSGRVDETTQRIRLAEEAIQPRQVIFRVAKSPSASAFHSLIGVLTGRPEQAMLGTGNCRQHPPAFHACNATATLRSERNEGRAPSRKCCPATRHPELPAVRCLPPQRASAKASRRLRRESDRNRSTDPDRDIANMVRPIVEDASNRPAVFAETQIRKCLTRGLSGVARPTKRRGSCLGESGPCSSR